MEKIKYLFFAFWIGLYLCEELNDKKLICFCSHNNSLEIVFWTINTGSAQLSRVEINFLLFLFTWELLSGFILGGNPLRLVGNLGLQVWCRRWTLSEFEYDQTMVWLEKRLSTDTRNIKLATQNFSLDFFSIDLLVSVWTWSLPNVEDFWKGLRIMNWISWLPVLCYYYSLVMVVLVGLVCRHLSIMSPARGECEEW